MALKRFARKDAMLPNPIYKYLFISLPRDNTDDALMVLHKRLEVLEQGVIWLSNHWDKLGSEEVEDAGGVCPVCSGPHSKENCPNQKGES